LAGGKKLSGNAQTRKQGCLLQHGTVLLGVDVDTMFELLKVPSEKLKGKLIQDVKERVSSLALALGRTVSYQEALAAFKAGFCSALHLVPEASVPSQAELQRAASLATERFSSMQWIAKR
ncbi:MAG TPA: lipoate--protein ligase family protein, partial [Spirochaetales bacterium]|nr:lipoate--protein ligase family protein [Spirochaetales bacterium]